MDIINKVFNVFLGGSGIYFMWNSIFHGVFGLGVVTVSACVMLATFISILSSNDVVFPFIILEGTPSFKQWARYASKIYLVILAVFVLLSYGVMWIAGGTWEPTLFAVGF